MRVRHLIGVLCLFAAAGGTLSAQTSTSQNGKPWFVLNGRQQVTRPQAPAKPLECVNSLTITNSPTPGVVGAPYSFQFTDTGGNSSDQWMWSAFDGPGGEIPPGLSLSASGLVTGVPTQANPSGFQVSVTVVNNPNPDVPPSFGFANFSVIVTPCVPSITSKSPLPTDDVSVPYTPLQIQVEGCQPPYTFTGGSPFQGGPGAFPPGMSISPNGILSGTPDSGSNGTYNISIKAQESGGGQTSATLSLTINPLPVVTNSSFPNGIVGAAYGPITLTTSGGTPPIRSYVDSGLPPGITLDDTGVLAGTPTQAGNFTPSLSVTDSVNGSLPKVFQIKVTTASEQLQVSPSSLQFTATANGSVPASQAVAVVPATSALPPYNFTIQMDGGQANTPAPAWLSVKPAASGIAPAQLVVSVSQGSLSAGSYSGRIRVIDSNGLENDVAVSLTLTGTPQKLDVSPGILHFSALQQSPGSLTAGLAVTSEGGNGPLGFSTSVVGGSSWITGISPSSGQTSTNGPVLLEVTVNSNGLAVGSYHDVIEVSSAAGSVNIPVALFVAEGGPILAINLTGVRLQAIQNGGFSNARTVQVLNLGDPNSTVDWSATLVKPASWLSIVTTSGTATTSVPGSLTFTLSPTATQMSPGGYYALIKLTDSNSRNSPQYLLVVLDLESANAAPLPDPNPAGFFFVATAGGPTTSSDVLTINTSSASAVPFQVATSTTDGGTWLVVTPTAGSASGAGPGTVNVAVNPAGLTPGVYTGNVNVSMSGALRTVNITMVVVPSGAAGAASTHSLKPKAAGCAATKAVITETGLVNNFAVPAGWPATLIVQLNDDCGDSLAGGAVVASFSNGDAPLTLSGNGQNGTYSGTWQPGSVTSELLITLNGTSGTLQPAVVQLNGGVAANQNQPPVLAPNGTLHNLNPVVGAPLAPGTIAEVFGSGLGPPVGVSPGVVPLVNTFDNTYVLIGPYQAPLFYLSSGQLDVQIPAELDATQQYQIVVSANNALTLPDNISIVPATPGVAAFANGGIIAQHTDFTLISSTSPAKPGEVVIIYLAGLGATNPSVPSGQPAPSTAPLAQVTSPVTVTVDGQKAVVDFAGLTPGAVGLYQIDFQVPTNASSGNLTVVVSQNGLAGNSTTLPVSQ